ncbi:MAG: hypothetical protein G01um101493_437, partial [Microgenomates group bacterium Gr01-1014_93]
MNQREMESVLKRFAIFTPDLGVYSIGISGPQEAINVKFMTGVFPAENAPFRTYATVVNTGLDVESYWKTLVDLDIPADEDRRFYLDLQTSQFETFAMYRELYRRLPQLVPNRNWSNEEEFFEWFSALKALKDDMPFGGSPIAAVMMGPTEVKQDIATSL